MILAGLLLGLYRVAECMQSLYNDSQKFIFFILLCMSYNGTLSYVAKDATLTLFILS